MVGTTLLRLVLRSVLGVGLMGALSACGQQVGMACTVKGSGFTLRDSCDTRCLSLSSVPVPGHRHA